MDISISLLAGFVALLALSGFFSGSEIALASLSRPKIRHLMTHGGRRRAALFARWLAHPERYLATLLIGNNLVNTAASALATLVAAELMGPGGMARAASIATGVMTFLILVFGEITPKVFCQRHAARIAPVVIFPLHWLSILLRPVERLVSAIAGALVWALSGGRPPPLHSFGEAELKAAVMLSGEAGVIEKREQTMIEGVLDIGDTTVREIMVPRVRMTVLPVGATREEVRRVVIESDHRRIPVYEGTRDQIVGFLNTHDLLESLLTGKEIDLAALIRPPRFVPETKPVGEMLAFFQRERIHLAMVVNEYGGVDGLVTLEDVLEEIVGDIADEHDDPPGGEIRTLENGVVQIDAGSEIREVARHLGTDFGETSAASLGGWLIERLGHIPQAGEACRHDGLEFQVTEATRRAVKKIEVRKSTGNTPAQAIRREA